MEYTFVFNEVAVLVRHWFEIDLIDSHLEHGARVELRLLVPQPRRGSESAAQKVVVDQPVWRADLFDRLDGTPGAFEAAHFHPYFQGVEPCERHWDDAVKAAPWDWLATQCHAWTRDAEAAVHTMLGAQRRPDLLDRERVSPWLPTGV